MQIEKTQFVNDSINTHQVIMKVSAAAVLLSISSASAFNVSYLNQLGGASGAAKAAPPVNPVVASGPASYLDNLNGTPELVSAIEAAPVAPAPVAAAPVAAAPVESSPTSASYLDSLPSNGGASGAGLMGYLDALASSSSLSGSGVGTYLDSVSPSAPVAPAPVAAAPEAAAPAPAAAAPAAAVDAPAVGDYLSSLVSNAPINGAGLMGYLSTLPQTEALSGAGLGGYLNILGSEAAEISGAGVTGYLDGITSNVIASESASSPSVTNFLESVYNQIMALPDDGCKTVNGDSVAYASANGPYAMSFVKN